MLDVTRRQALAAMGGFGASLGLSGCATPIVPFCPGDPTVSDPTSPLTIDVHTHVFNGSDLQIFGFYNYVVARQIEPTLLAVLLEMLGRDFAPTAIDELVALQEAEVALRNCNGPVFVQVLNSHAQDRYDRFLAQLKAANRNIRSRRFARGLTSRSRIDSLIETLPRSYSDYKKLQRSKARFALADATALGEIEFVQRNFQFRYVNVYDYLFEYSTGRNRKIDVMVAHLVDFDWPLGGGNPTTTSLSDQFRVMDKISQLTGGRVLCFAPFDPFKEVAYQLGLTPESSLQNVQTAILLHGFIGAKIYPPMGFAPFGNAALDGHGFWDKPWIPASLHRSDLGRLLDNALATLYYWCLHNGVPIMGHSSRTSGPSDAFQNLAGAEHWGPIPNQLAGIRIDFGHFGLKDLGKDDQEIRLASYMDVANGNFLYADAGYFSEVLSQASSLQAFLTTLYRATRRKGDAALAQRLMYGTDWEMIVREGPTSSSYLEDFEKMFAVLDHEDLGAKGKLSDRFFGVNAATFLGLGPNQPTRTRLDRYYGLSSKPAWMSKVDKLPTAIS
jgi:hypothetical protein